MYQQPLCSQRCPDPYLPENGNRQVTIDLAAHLPLAYGSGPDGARMKSMRHPRLNSQDTRTRHRPNTDAYPYYNQRLAISRPSSTGLNRPILTPVFCLKTSHGRGGAGLPAGSVDLRVDISPTSGESTSSLDFRNTMKLAELTILTRFAASELTAKRPSCGRSTVHSSNQRRSQTRWPPGYPRP